MQLMKSVLTVYNLFVVHVACDAVITFQSGITYSSLVPEELALFHAWLCNTTNDWYHFDTSHTLTLLNFTAAASNVKYTDIYNCSIQPVYIQCTRIKQSNLGSTFLNKGSSSFSLTNVTSCDMDCVSVVWGSQNVATNIIDGSAIYGVCPTEVRILNTRIAPTVIIIAVVVGTVITIISISAVVFVCKKRRVRVQTTVLNSVSSDTYDVLEVSDPQEHHYIRCEAMYSSLSDTT